MLVETVQEIADMWATKRQPDFKTVPDCHHGPGSV